MNIRPKWVGNSPRNHSNSFYFVEVHSDASLSLNAARAAVKQEIASNVERTDKVSVCEVFEDNSTQNYIGADISLRSRDSYQLTLNIEGHARPITSRRIDEYWQIIQRGGISLLDYHALFAVEKKDAVADFSGISVVSSYGAHGLWRSAIVPGWGQFHKGANLKGGLILGGCAALAVGIVFTENQRSDYARKIVQTHNVEFKRMYATKRDHFATGRNICIGAIAALYVYNLIDAVAAPGARRVVVHSRNRGRGSYAFVPTILDNETPAFAASLTF